MANRIVQEVLAFVRPIRLQVEDISRRRRHPRRDDDGREPARSRARSRSASTSRKRCGRSRAIRAQLRQIFTNFLTNAFEAMSGTGLVEITARRAGRRRRQRAADHGTARRSSDHGVGQRPRHSAGGHAIASSARSSRRSRRAPGLGPRHRPQDRRRARRADRRRRACRAAGRCSAVTLRVQEVGSSSLFRLRRGHMGRILVADDHDSLRRGIVPARCRTREHEVDEAPNGNVAIEKLHEGQCDVVLSDLKMGGSDGLDVLRTREGAAPDERGHPDDGVRIGPHGGRGDEDRRVRLRAEAVRDRGDGAQGREGPRAPPPQARDRVPAPHAAGHLRLRSHRRRERRAAVGAGGGQEGRQEQHDVPDPRRDGHRQGADRRRDPPQLAARRRATSSR